VCSEFEWAIAVLRDRTSQDRAAVVVFYGDQDGLEYGVAAVAADAVPARVSPFTSSRLLRTDGSSGRVPLAPAALLTVNTLPAKISCAAVRQVRLTWYLTAPRDVRARSRELAIVPGP